MLDTSAATLALRNQALTLLVCTTGPQTLTATATGYSRPSGSFVSDGFADGMEFVPAGFTDNTPRIIESVSALTIVTTTPVTAQSSGAGRSLSVALPLIRAFGNRRDFKRIDGRPYIEEEFVPGGSGLISAPAQGGIVQEDGLYIIKWYGLEGKGELGIRRCTDALKALFVPGVTLVAGGVTLRVRTDTTVKSGQILPQGNGWAVCSVTVPWWAMSNNVVPTVAVGTQFDSVQFA